MRTCSLICHEALAVLYGNARFTLQLDCQMIPTDGTTTLQALHTVLGTFTPAAKACIKTIGVDCTAYRDVVNDFADLCAILRDFPHLQTLSIQWSLWSDGHSCERLYQVAGPLSTLPCKLDLHFLTKWWYNVPELQREHEISKISEKFLAALEREKKKP